ncbi:hypothetical protein [Flavilitoribacter nigricans]|uniref:Uncharacterized protein n=1 Tax=Flavilitoribacter nigricans (strain ATCC 23147 / DSM 23189 / NBRC 102662 / NCIMB 1420 / SS-2) TaxID=1122177 RepID=A0A2D0MX11_FLAN2|nr:hypothetical protein [Flavilitoribacter nigricans]PHN00720.1 hypothetical protein CRP01_40770 [Flavilitoribacter nigricans DSM 23189 = NBRC 102662]
MINDEEGKVLHDKASRGKQLSEVELRQLEEWYACQDHLESEAIQLPANHTVIADLQDQIGQALDELSKLTNRIKKVATENEQLRQENTILLTKVK